MNWFGKRFMRSWCHIIAPTARILQRRHVPQRISASGGDVKEVRRNEAMRTLILGGDGYLGWPTALHLSQRGHDVAVLDNFARRAWDHELGAESLTPIRSLHERVAAWREVSGRTIVPFVGDVCDYTVLEPAVREFQPQAVVHFGEQRSAPFSMIDRRHALLT